MEIIYKNISDLKEYDNNPRLNDEAVDKVAKSIDQFGFKVPVVIDKNDTIVCGHTRIKASKQLGLKEIPCIIAEDLNEEQIKAYRLIDNKTSDYSHWDFDKLELELKQLEDIKDFEMKKFGFITKEDAFFNRDIKQGRFEHQDDNDEYNSFIDKFNTIKMNSDDCYTPKEIYDAVVEFVESEYKVDRKNFVRPFYPGGDYENCNYKDSDIVVDNPPFSIYSKIVNYYVEKGIKFFLFTPGITCLCPKIKDITYIIINSNIEYENGAKIPTNFITNLDRELGIKTAKILKKLIVKKQSKELTKYKYPQNALKITDINSDVDIYIKSSEYEFANDFYDKNGKRIHQLGTRIIASDNIINKINSQKTKQDDYIDLFLNQEQQNLLQKLNKRK